MTISGRTLCRLLGMILMAGSAQAMADTLDPSHVRELIGDKPKLENYTDYNTFLSDTVDYKRKLHALQEQGMSAFEAPLMAKGSRPAAAPAPGGSATPEPVSAPEPEPVSKVTAEVSLDQPGQSYVIDGPEDLDNAVEKAKHLPHPNYHVNKRFNRTTSQSFPLSTVDGNDLSDAQVEGALGETAAGPEIRAAQTGLIDLNETVLASNSDDPDTKKSTDSKRRQRDRSLSSASATAAEGRRQQETRTPIGKVDIKIRYTKAQ